MGKMNNIIGLIKREILINFRFVANRLPLALIVLAVFIMMPTSPNFKEDQLIILGFSINLFFFMILYIQMYLQEHKDKEIIFLITLQIKKENIVVSKLLFTIIINSFFNILMIIPLVFISSSFNVVINAYIINVFIGTITGVIIFSYFLKSNFELFLSMSQYLRVLIYLIFIALIYLFKLQIKGISYSLDFNPLYIFLLLIFFTYLFYKTLCKMFSMSKMYL